MAGELEIINDEDLQAPLDLAANYKKLANDFDALAASTSLLQSKLEKQDTSTTELTKHIKQLEAENKKLQKTNKDAAKSAAGMAAGMELADAATGGLVTNVKALKAQFIALIANPVVAMLVALGAVLLSVGTYFKQTNEGADKLERIMGAMNGVIDFLVNKFAALGEQIVKLFEDGNIVGKIFMAIFERIINIIAGVIDTFTNLLRIVNTLSKYNLKDILTGNLKPEDVKELNNAFKDLGKSAFQAITGIGDAAEQVGAKIRALDALIQEGQQLGDDLRNRILSKAQAELAIEKLLFEAKDKTHNTDEQRLAAIKQAVKLSEDQLKVELELAVRKERHYTAELLFHKDIIKSNEESNAVLKQGTTLQQDALLEAKASDEELEERKKLQAEVFNLQRQYFAETKKSIQQIAELEKEITDERIKQAEIEVKARLKAYDERLAASKVVEGRELIGFKSRLEEQKDLQRNFDERMKNDAKQREEEEKEREKRRTEMLKEQEEKRRLIRETAIVAIGMIGDEMFNRRIEKLNEEFAHNEDLRKQELEAAGDDERKKLAINRKFDREQAKIKTKQAQADKSAAMFGIIINTALGIMKAAPVVPLMIATGILGAIQLALVASKPIPKFAAGTDSSPDTFIAGEKGRELISHNGKLSIADKATLFTGMAGARIFSNPATEEILGDIGDIGGALLYGTKVRRAQHESSKVAEALQENNKWLKRIAEKEGIVEIHDDFGDNRYYNRVAARNRRINKRFYGK